MFWFLSHQQRDEEVGERKPGDVGLKKRIEVEKFYLKSRKEDFELKVRKKSVQKSWSKMSWKVDPVQTKGWAQTKSLAQT